MRKLQLFSLIAVLAILSSCGSQNPNPAAYNYGYGVNGAQTGYPYNNYNSWNAWNSGSTQTPLYQNGQLVGYKVRQPILGGTYSNITSNIFSQSVSVNAGDRLFINLTNMQYGAVIRCDRKLLDSIDNKRGGLITNAAISLNGQAIGGGNGGIVVAPSSGTLTISADLSALNGISCGWHNDRPYQVLSYWVSLSNYAQGYPYYVSAGSGAAVEVERCVNTANAPIACPY